MSYIAGYTYNIQIDKDSRVQLIKQIMGVIMCLTVQLTCFQAAVE